MDPHFIFNALNSVCGLVRDDENESAVQMLVALSTYLRNAAQRPLRPLVTLAEEVGFLKQYLEIQKCRFGARLEVLIDVPAELLPLRVPSLLLQPLAENAIKHGLSQRAEGGTIRVMGMRVADKLQVIVRNSAPPTAVDGSSPGLGVGLANLRARLNLIYQDDQALTVQRATGGDVEVCITLPIGRDALDAAA